MNNSMYSRKNSARVERQQRKLAAGLMDARFPEVASIVVSMTYRQRGMPKPMLRTVNYFPGSYALFTIDCLNRECVAGGFDLSRIIAGMVRNRKETAKGDLCCEGEGLSADHATIAYEVAIHYL